MPVQYRSFLPLLLLLSLMLSACAARTTQPPPIQATAPRPAETDANPASLPTDSTAHDASAYPYPNSAAASQPTLLPSDSYPAPEGPSGVQARPNQSQIVASLVEISADPDNPALTRVRALVQKVEVNQEAGGDFASNLVNQEVDFFVKGIEVPDLQPGDVFSAEVTYNGDEAGGRFFITGFVE